jgi:hypothetical protein
MAPQHIDDLPRHEECRQLMLGLIDDLPESQERRGTQLVMMLGLGLLVVLFVGLVWVTAPSS